MLLFGVFIVCVCRIVIYDLDFDVLGVKLVLIFYISGMIGKLKGVVYIYVSIGV